MKNKETLEEARANSYIDFAKSNEDVSAYSFVAGWDKGAKWQKERSYSEEEVKKILHDWSIYKVNCIVDEFIDILTWEEWFEQFKNK